MSDQEVSEFDARILAYHRQGVRPSHIAERLHIKASDVRQRMHELGVAIEVNPAAPKAYASIWEMGEDQRRRAIAERASKGAREALRA